MAVSRKKDKTEHYTKLIRNTLETYAWRALSSTAQALYPWLKLEWRGALNNNGKIRMSVRQASRRLGIGCDAASYAFHDLQRKGFLVVTTPARLGMGGEAKSPTYEITELALPHGEKSSGRKLYLDWRKGGDYPVQKAMANNPKGVNRNTKAQHQNEDVQRKTIIKMRTFWPATKNKTLSRLSGWQRHDNRDVQQKHVTIIGMAYPENHDVLACFGPSDVTIIGTSLLYQRVGVFSPLPKDRVVVGHRLARTREFKSQMLDKSPYRIEAGEQK